MSNNWSLFFDSRYPPLASPASRHPLHDQILPTPLRREICASRTTHGDLPSLFTSSPTSGCRVSFRPLRKGVLCTCAKGTKHTPFASTGVMAAPDRVPLKKGNCAKFPGDQTASQLTAHGDRVGVPDEQLRRVIDRLRGEATHTDPESTARCTCAAATLSEQKATASTPAATANWCSWC